MPSDAPPKFMQCWIAPKTEYEGVVAGSPWLPAACERAVALFEDASLHRRAVVLATAHEVAIDYLVQAPALVVAAIGDTDLSRRDQRQRVVRRFEVACSTRPRLKDLMRCYGLAPPLRALSGGALCRHHRCLLKPLSELPASRLAQAIPATVKQQVDWLGLLFDWHSAVRPVREANWITTWAAANVRHRQCDFKIFDVIDFMVRNKVDFDVDWNFADVMAASERWHEAVTCQSMEETCTAEQLAAVADYGTLPDAVEIDDHQFVALRTRPQIFEEAHAMHHCVAT